MKAAGITILLLLILCGFACPFIMAEVATTQEMERVCLNWLSYRIHQYGTWAGVNDPFISAVHEIEADGLLLGRCYSIYPRGYVVVPVLKELPPIKAWSDECNLNPDQRVGFIQLLREALCDRTRLYEQTYGSIHASQPHNGDVLFDRKNRRGWKLFASNQNHFSGGIKTMGGDCTIGPLLSTYWNQRTPYNDYCPQGLGGKCVAGCLPIAVAQIMKYHNWPPCGLGSHTYTWDGDGMGPQDLTADFSDAYDWGNIPDHGKNCTPAERDALAELCYEVGVAFETDYGYKGSSASLSRLFHVMPDFFRYENSIEQKSRKNYSFDDWFQLIRQEIEASRPMLYYIYNHAIVCDGYHICPEHQQYHINYGWGGSQTGWYSIDHIYGSDDVQKEMLYRKIMPDQNHLYVVDPYGGGHFQAIQYAINAALDGFTILVKHGTYYENINFLGKEIVLRSDEDGVEWTYDWSPEKTVIDGKRTGSVVTFQTGEGTDTVLWGFTLRNGSGKGYGGFTRGGGIYCSDASPTIRNNIISDNKFVGKGGGIYCSNAAPTIRMVTFSENTCYEGGGGICCEYGSEPSIVQCTFDTNVSIHQHGGGIFATDSALSIRDVVLTGNMADSGAGIYLYDSSSMITECTLYDNDAGEYGGGIYVQKDASTILSNIISGNESKSGGGIYLNDSAAILVNNVITENATETGYAGGGICCTGSSSPTITHNTLFGNWATRGGGIWCTGSSANVANTILWSNVAADGSEICLESSATLHIDHSDITGLVPPFITLQPGCILNPGFWLISADPIFKKPYEGNFHLSPYSPCIDSGDRHAPAVPETDFEGDPRVFNLDTDMGADEFRSLRIDSDMILGTAGGVVDFILEAGDANAYRPYFLLGSLTGTEPGMPLPGGTVLPINFDPLTGIIFRMFNTPYFSNFSGSLDASGYSEAPQLNIPGPLPPEMVGLKMSFAYTLLYPFNFVSNPVEIEIMEFVE